MKPCGQCLGRTLRKPHSPKGSTCPLQVGGSESEWHFFQTMQGLRGCKATSRVRGPCCRHPGALAEPWAGPVGRFGISCCSRESAPGRGWTEDPAQAQPSGSHLGFVCFSSTSYCSLSHFKKQFKILFHFSRFMLFEKKSSHGSCEFDGDRVRSCPVLSFLRAGSPFYTPACG